jgi:hypothetical protein
MRRARRLIRLKALPRRPCTFMWYEPLADGSDPMLRTTAHAIRPLVIYEGASLTVPRPPPPVSFSDPCRGGAVPGSGASEQRLAGRPKPSAQPPDGPGGAHAAGWVRGGRGDAAVSYCQSVAMCVCVCVSQLGHLRFHDGGRS